MKRSLIKTGDYESPETKEFEMTLEGVLCASQAEIDEFNRNSNVWDWE